MESPRAPHGPKPLLQRPVRDTHPTAGGREYLRLTLKIRAENLADGLKAPLLIADIPSSDLEDTP